MSSKFLDSKKRRIFSSSLIPIIVLILIGYFLRTYFIPWDIQFISNDAFLFLLEGLAFSEGNFEHFSVRALWPIFLSFFFLIFKFDDLIGYTTLIRYLVIIISVSTIPLVYFISKQFVEKKFAIFAAAIFAFDPSILQNSILGIREPILILLGMLSFYFIVQKNEKLIPLAFVFSGLAFDAKLNGIVFILLAFISLFLTIRPKRKLIINLIFGIVILLFIISPHIILPLEYDRIPFLRHFIDATEIIADVKISPSTFVESETYNSSKILTTSLMRELIHLGRISLPYLWILAPIGFFVSIKSIDYNKKILLTGIFLSLLIAFPMYFQSAEYRNLLIITPFLCILAAIGVQKLFINIKSKKLFLILLIIGLFIFSFIFLIITNPIDKEIILEKENISKYIITNFSGRFMGDLYTNIVHNIPDVIQGGVEGTSNSLYYNENFSITIQDESIDSGEKLIEVSTRLNVDYIIIDDVVDNRYPIFEKIFNNEKQCSFLEKKFDSKELGYNLIHVKVFKTMTDFKDCNF